MRVNTLFPSSKDDEGRTKGGVVLLRLVRKKRHDGKGRGGGGAVLDESIKLRVSYEDRCGVPDFCEQVVVPPPRQASKTCGGYAAPKDKDIEIECGGGYGSRQEKDGIADDGNAVEDGAYFENDGVRKAVLLARYATVLKRWLLGERTALATRSKQNKRTAIAHEAVSAECF